MSVEQAFNPSPQAPTPARNTSCVDCGNLDVIDCGPCRRPMLMGGIHEEEKQLAESFLESRLLKCRGCRLAFRFPVAAEDVLQRMYAKLPADRWNSSAVTNYAWNIASKWMTARYRNHGPVRVIDVGAFDGAFLRTLPPSWDLYAIEPSIAARASLAMSGIPSIAEYVGEPTSEDSGAFDVMTMFDVFEHLTTPYKSLRGALGYLKPGGSLIISTGNCDHWTWRLLRGQHWYLSTPHHVVFGGLEYFRNASKGLNAKLTEFRFHPHQNQEWRDLARQLTETLVFSGRVSANRFCRTLAGAMLKVPMLRALRHAECAPYAPAIRDHLLVILQKEGET